MTVAATMEDVGNFGARLGFVERSMGELRADNEARFNKIDSKLDAIASGKQPQWQIWIAAASFVLIFTVTVGGAVIYPMKENLSRIEQSGASATTELKTAMAKFSDSAVSERELASVMANTKDRRDDAQRVAEARFARIEKDVDSVQDKVVSRGEIETHWQGQTARDSEIQRQIDDVRGRVEGIYSPKDELQSLHRQVEALTSAVSASQSRR